MAVYVDDMKAGYRRMVMCHMIADTSDELHEMARKIGVQRKWCQAEGTHREHYDICLSKRAEAVRCGAREVSQMDLGRMLRARRLATRPGQEIDRDSLPKMGPQV